MTKKNLGKMHSAVIKENASNMTGAAKLYSALFANGSDLKTVCRALEIPVEYAVKVSALAKDKKEIVKVCCQMLPKVGGTFVRFTLYSKIYKDGNVNKEKGIESKEVKNIAYGEEYKPFGFASPEPLEGKNSAKWLTRETDEYRATYVAVKITSYSIRMIAKCVSEYLAHESNQQ